jgi:hypothetical protein
MRKSNNMIEVNLNGNARNRRKQFRALVRKYPKASITRRAGNEYYSRKILNDVRVTVEDANSPQTVVRIWPEQRTKNACECTICNSPAEVSGTHYECQQNPNHMGDTFVGIFSDLTPP